MSKKVAIYTRVSTTNQAEEGYSIDEQIDKLKMYCEAMDWKVSEIYTDAGFSGSKLTRPAMEKMITDIGLKKFDTVIIEGGSMYINDVDLRNCYASLADVLNEGAIVYIEECIGVNERLTLDHIWSDSLKDNYDAIYRTRKEYLELMSGLTNRVQILKEGYFEQLDKKELSETSHWYIFLKKC